MIRSAGSGRLRLLVAAGAIGITLIVAGCGSSSSSSTTATGSAGTSTAGAATLSTATVTGLGTVLVNGQGLTLYIFEPDAHARVTCTGACASVWPPLLASGQTPTVSGAAKASLVASDPNPGGGQVVTYAGWPLYTYVADSSPGTAHGQALNLNGGLWYVMSPSGAVVTKSP